MRGRQRSKKTLVLKNDVNEIGHLNAFVKDLCQALHIDQDTATGVCLAVEEAVVNVMNYAYPAGTEGEIRVKAFANANRLTFEISDDGIPFDPTAATKPDLTLPAEQRPIGGLGIYLMRQYMDTMKYKRVKDCNILSLTKQIHHEDNDSNQR
ncbi:MAG: ATP-binding protein [Bacteroidaceae bacterium]|nr:ATP-binding protein [Bacteroidaceae bacterium]